MNRKLITLFTARNLAVANLILWSPNAVFGATFDVGDRIQANNDAYTRPSPGACSGTLIGIGSIGTVLNGPTNAPLCGGSSYTWYRIAWTVGTTGWTASILLNLAPPVTLDPGTSTLPGPVLNTLVPLHTWQAVPGAGGYGLYVRDTDANVLVYPNASGTTATPFQGTSFTLPSGYLQPGRNYRWNMTSFKGTTEYVPPQGGNYTRFFSTRALPEAPSGLESIGLLNSIDLGWSVNADNEDGFEIERRFALNDWITIASLGPNQTSYSDTAVSQCIVYVYRVRAFNGVGKSSHSNTADNYVRRPPASPSNLSSVSGPSAIGLAWTDNACDETEIVVERKTGPFGAWAKLVTLEANATSHADSSAVLDVPYFYRVYARNQYGGSAYSGEVAGIRSSIPNAPSDLTASFSYTEQKVTLSWNDNSANEAGFQLEKRFVSSGITVNIDIFLNATGYEDSDVSIGTSYCYRIRAKNSAGDSPYSNEACLTPQIPTYTLTVSAGNGSVSIEPQMTEYPHGRELTLTAYPDPNYWLYDWRGDLSGVGNTLRFRITQNTRIEAFFQPLAVPISMQVAQSTPALGFQFTIPAAPEMIHVVQSSDDLCCWRNLRVVDGHTASTLSIDPTMAGKNMEVFRIQDCAKIATPRFLMFPVKNMTSRTAPVSSIFDHHEPVGRADGVIMTYQGEMVKLAANNGWYYVAEGSNRRVSMDPSSPAFYKRFTVLGYERDPDHRLPLAFNYLDESILWYDGHGAYDYAVDVNEEVIAASSGYTVPEESDDCYNAICIDHGNGYRTYYLHLSERANTLMSNGHIQRVWVDAGTYIGRPGNVACGSAVGVHLHFTVKRNNGAGQWIRVDPYGKYAENGDLIEQELWLADQ